MDAHTGGESPTEPQAKARAERSPQFLPYGNEEPDTGSHPFASLQALKDRLTAKQPKATRLTLLERVVAKREALELLSDAQVVLRDTDPPTAVGALTPGADLLAPSVRLAPELPQDRQLQQELTQFSRQLVESYFGPLRAAGRGELGAPGRGLVYQLEQELGCVEARRAREQLSLLTPGERARLEELGVVFGERFIYLAPLQGQRALAHRRAWLSLVHKLPLVPPGAVRVASEGATEGALRQLGFPRLGAYFIRVDIYERLLRHLRALAQAAHPDGFPLPLEVCQWLGMPKQELPMLLQALGYTALDRKGKRWASGRTARRQRQRNRRSRQRSPNATDQPKTTRPNDSATGQGRQT
ncbi:MAG: hypothetical protein R3B07_32255 [Polyangiaceae bacterium]